MFFPHPSDLVGTTCGSHDNRRPLGQFALISRHRRLSWSPKPTGIRSFLGVVLTRHQGRFSLVEAPGSLGCGTRGVTSTVIHTCGGIVARTPCSCPSSSAFHNPGVRHAPGSTGGFQSRRRWSSVASSPARTAARAFVPSTTASGAPAGTRVLMAVRNSVEAPSGQRQVRAVARRLDQAKRMRAAVGCGQAAGRDRGRRLR
jgi:hypothetical protein